MSDLPPEFALIARHFRPLAGAGALALADDAAVFAPPPGRELVVSADAMVAGVHFLPDDPPALIGRRLLRTNLSDLAAMGAVPLGYLMTVSVPRETPDAWFAGFAAGLAADQAEFGIALLGGDSTATPGPVSLSLTVLGHVAPGRRCGVPARGRAMRCGSAAASATARWGCWPRAGRSPIRMDTSPIATGCRGRGWRSARRWRGSRGPVSMCRTGWCRIAAICAGPAGWAASSRRRACRCRRRRGRRTGWRCA